MQFLGSLAGLIGPLVPMIAWLLQKLGAKEEALRLYYAGVSSVQKGRADATKPAEDIEAAEAELNARKKPDAGN